MRKKLGEILVAQGAVRPEDVDSALEQQSGGDPARIGDLLIGGGKISSLQLAKALCEQSGLPFVVLDQVSPDVAALVPIELQREYCLVPFREDGPRKAIHVAVADPTTSDVLADLEFQVGRSLKISIAARDEIEAVHAALTGDVLEGSIVEDDAPAPQKSPQALGRVALKRVAVSPAGVMTDAARPTVEMPIAGHGAAIELPRRAKRPTSVAPPAPPMLKPVDPPARKEADEWAVRPAASAIPKGGKSVIVPPPPPPVLDPFAAMPTELIGGPREYEPAEEPPPGVPDATLHFGKAPRLDTGSHPPIEASSAPPRPRVADGTLHFGKAPRLDTGSHPPTEASSAPPRPRVADATLPFGKAPPFNAEPLFAKEPPPPRATDLLGTDSGYSLEPLFPPMPAAAAVEAPPKEPGSRELPPLSALDADPDLSETLRGPELPPSKRSKLAIEPAPLALTPPPPTGSRRKPVQTLETGVPAIAPLAAPEATAPDAGMFAPAETLLAYPHAPAELPAPASDSEMFEPAALDAEVDAALEASLFGPEVTAEPAPPLPSPVPKVDEVTIAAPVTATRPPPQPVPSGRDKRVETQLEFSPKPVSIRDTERGTDPEAPAAPRAAVKTDPAFGAEPLRRTESLEFIPPAETAPRPLRPVTASRPAAPLPPELAPPLVPPATPPNPPPSVEPGTDELPSPRPATPPRPAPAPVEPPPPAPERAATPPEGTPAIAPPATPPELRRAMTPAHGSLAAPQTLVSGAVTAPAELTASIEDPAPALPPLGDAVLTAAPIEEPPPAAEPAAPVVSPAPMDLAVSELPEWMRDGSAAGAQAPAIDTLGLALASPLALQRVVRLLISKGLLTEAELLEELKKQ